MDVLRNMFQTFLPLLRGSEYITTFEIFPEKKYFRKIARIMERNGKNAFSLQSASQNYLKDTQKFIGMIKRRQKS